MSTLFEEYFGKIVDERRLSHDNKESTTTTNPTDSIDYARQLRHILRALRHFLSEAKFFGLCWERAQKKTRFHILDQETFEMHPSVFNPIEAQLIKAHKHRTDAYLNTLDKDTHQWFQREWEIPATTSEKTVQKLVQAFLNLFQHYYDILNWGERRRLQHAEYPHIFPSDDPLLDDTCGVLLACLEYMSDLYQWFVDQVYTHQVYEDKIPYQVNESLQTLVHEFGQSTHETQQQAQHNISLPGVRNQTNFPHIQPNEIERDIHAMRSRLQFH